MHVASEAGDYIFKKLNPLSSALNREAALLELEAAGAAAAGVGVVPGEGEEEEERQEWEQEQRQEQMSRNCSPRSVGFM